MWPGVASLAQAVGDREHRAYLQALAGMGVAATELAAGNPALFYMVARTAHDQQLPVERAAALCRLPRARLMAALGCDGSAAAERLLRRCVFLRLDDAALLALRALAARPPEPWLCHQRGVLVDLLVRHPYDAWPALCRVLAVTAEDCGLGAALAPGREVPKRDARWLLRILLEQIGQVMSVGSTVAVLPGRLGFSRERLLQALAACRSLAELNVLQADLIARRDSWHGDEPGAWGRPWPRPPVQGTATIVPLTHGQELSRESVEMQHCIRLYGARVQAGKGYVYRVLEPQRATAYIVPRGGRWELAELRLRCNREPARATELAVLEWLESGT